MCQLAQQIFLRPLYAQEIYITTPQQDLKVYSGSVWEAVTAAVTELDGGVFDSIAPYNGGDPTTTATQSYDGGTP
jgi:hypothetical protein